MSKSTGRTAAFGLAKESSRGTAESAADVWIPRLSVNLDDKTESINDESALGVLEDAPNADNVKTSAEMSLEGNIRDKSIGHLLLALFGGVSSTTDSPETGSNTHVFNLVQSAQHQSFTLFSKDAVQSYKHALGVMSSFGISAEIGQYVKFTSGFMAKAGEQITDPSPSYIAENLFLPKNITVKYAANQAGLDAGTEVKVQNFSLTFDKATEEDMALGDSTPQDFLTKMFSCEGEIEMLFDAETFKTQQLANTKIALRLDIENDTDDLGSSVYPQLTLDVYKAHISDFVRNYGNGDLVSASVSFKALYSVSDSKMVTATLINGQTSY
jgi:hypothetical protein